jgi:chemosensory pili system protein ChpA (sensor histidine kinase/response regulator)
MHDSDEQPAPAERRALDVHLSSQVQVPSQTDARVPAVGPTADPTAADTTPGDDGAAKLSEEELALLDAFHKSPLVPARWSTFLNVEESAQSVVDFDAIPDELRQTCIAEAAEDLEVLRTQVLRLEREPSDRAPVGEMGRIAHKIRGSASTFGLDILAQIALMFEDVQRALRSRRSSNTPPDMKALTGLLDLMERALSIASADGAPDPDLVAEGSRIREHLLAQIGTMSAAPPGLSASASDPAHVVSPESDTHPALPLAMQLEAAHRVDPHRLDRLMDDASTLPLARATLLQTREDIGKLQTELDQSLMRLAQLGRQLSDLHPTLAAATLYSTGSSREGRSSWTTSALSQTTSASAQPEVGMLRPTEPPASRRHDFALEQYTEFDHFARALAEAIEDATSTGRALGGKLSLLGQNMDEQAHIAREIQHDVVHLRLIPLSGIVHRLQLEVRRLAPVVGKSVAFSARGEMTELDRAITGGLVDPLVQLVRNALVHGIEAPGERAEAGKPPEGSVWFHASYMGSDVVIEIGDDGRGVNPHRLVAAAEMAGIVDPTLARSLSAPEALELMFVPGLTTFDTPQVLSGHGIGLDHVRTNIERLKGSLQVRSEVGSGTVFRIRVPMSLSVVKALHVRAGGQDYAVPFSAVQRTLKLTRTELLASEVPDSSGVLSNRVALRIRIEPAYSSSPLLQPIPAEHRLEEIPAYPLAELLGFAQERRDPQLALVVERGPRRVALLVDEILEDQEAVVQTLPAHLRRGVIRGATVTAEGRLLLLLDLQQIVSAVVGGTPVPAVHLGPIPRPQQRPVAPRVLVVDDSVSVRRALESALTRAGFEVQLARDGVEALETMLASPPAVLLLDIEMPRLDGFELLSILRGSPQFDGVRVVMLTSRTGPALREHALQLGAAAYLTKPCPQETIIDTVRAQLVQSAPGQ